MNSPDAKPTQVFTWRLLYAFIVVWMSSFALLSPLARRESIQFQSTAQVKYSLNPQQQLSGDELTSLLKTVVGQVIQPDVLGQIREKIGQQTPDTAKAALALGTDDLAAIRSRLTVSQVNQGPDLRLAIVFRGKGSADEQEFVNQLANRLALEIPRYTDQVALTRLMDANSKYMDMAKQVNLAEQMRAEVAQLNESIAGLKSQAAGEPPKSLAEQLQDLEKQKADLVQSQNVDSSHPQIVELQQQIESLRTEILNDPSFRPVQVGATQAESGDAIKNHYYQASTKSPTEATTPVPLSAEALATIDLTRIGTAATQLKTHAESVRDLQRDLDAAMASHYQSELHSFANLTSVQYSTAATMLPRSGLLPTWLLIVPCLIGALVAMYYNPVADRMQLKSLADVARSMKLNVVAELPSSQTLVAPLRSERWSARAVRGAEYSLIGLGCVLFAACALKPQVLSAAISNPLLAVSNWFWLIAG